MLLIFKAYKHAQETKQQTQGKPNLANNTVAFNFLLSELISNKDISQATEIPATVKIKGIVYLLGEVNR